MSADAHDLEARFYAEGAPAPDARAEDLLPMLDRLRRIRGVSWEWRAGTEAFHEPGRTRQIGVIAQEVEAVFPDAVVTDADDGYKLVDYAGLVAVLVETVKELADRVDALECEGPAPSEADPPRPAPR